MENKQIIKSSLKHFNSDFEAVIFPMQRYFVIEKEISPFIYQELWFLSKTED